MNTKPDQSSPYKPQTPTSIFSNLFSTSIITIIVLVIIFGLVMIQTLYNRHEQNNIEQLTAIAALKSNQVQNWLDIHRLQAEMLRESPPLNRHLNQLIKDKNSNSKKFIQNRLASLQQLYGYLTTYIIDNKGNLIVGINDDAYHPLSADEIKEFNLVFNTKKVLFTEFHLEKSKGKNNMHLSIVVPFKNKHKLALVMQLGQSDFKIPSLQTWPVPSASAETILFQRDEDNALVIHDLRFEKGDAFVKSIPLNKLNRPVSMVINGTLPYGELFEELDSRGIRVIGIANFIEGTQWHLIVKIDSSEAYSELYKDLTWAIIAIVLALFSIISVAILRNQWKVLQKIAVEQRDEAEASAGENQQQVSDLLNSTAEAIIGVDLNGNCSFANLASVQLLGYQNASELIDLNLCELIHNQHKNSPKIDDKILSTIKNGHSYHIDGELLFRSNGSSFLAEYWSHPILRDGELSGSVVTFVDITDRKNIETQANKLAQVVEQNPNSIIITNLKGDIEYINDAFIKTTGYSKEEALLRNPKFLQSGKTSKETYDSMWKSLSQGNNWKGELCNKKKDGTRFIEFVNISPIFQPDGTFQHYAAVKEDITEKKRLGAELDKHRNNLESLVKERTQALEEQTELALKLKADAEASAEQKTKYLHQVQQSEEKFRNIVETSSDFIWETNAEGIYTYVSPFVEKLLGHKPEDILGKTPFDFMTHLERKRVESIFLDYVTHKKSFKNLENINIHKNGSEVLLSTSAIPFFDNEGELLGYRGLDRDITDDKKIATELEESKEQLTLALNSARLGLWDWNPQDNTMVTNDIYFTMLGHNPDDFPKSLNRWDSLIHPDDIEPALAALQPFLDGDNGEYHFEQRMLTANNQWRWIMDVGRVIDRDQNGKVLRFIGVHIDITKLKEAEHLAEAANQSKSDFLANMSHEIRTPMNAVLGLTYLLSETHLNEKQQDFVNKISGSGKALLEIINDILDFSKIEAGHMELDEQPFSLKQLIDNINSVIHPSMAMNSTELEISSLPEGIDTIKGDSLRLQQILINFLSNAAKFSKQDKVWLNITLQEQKQIKNDRWVKLRFTVKDNGIGIPIEKQAEIFNAFSQEDVSITRKFGGTGLGLAICSRLTHLMNGKLGVKSEVGLGSEFWVDLSFKQLKTVDLNDNNEPTQDTFISLKNIHILVVDDSEINREVVKSILTLHQATVSFANDGQQAIDFLKENTHQTDIVFMDIQMPILDGIQATRIIRNELKLKLPIIAFTAGAFKEQEDICFEAGMNSFLSKPVDVQNLFKTIQQWVPNKIDNNTIVNTLDTPQFERNPPLSNTLDSLPGLDISKGLINWQAEKPYKKYLGKFIDTYIQSDIAISNDIKNKNYDNAAAMTHKLKGVAGNLGMPKLSQLAGELNNLLKKSSNDLDINDAAEKLSHELQLALRSIETYLSDQTQPNEAIQKNVLEANPEIIKPLLQKLLIALEGDNPNDVEPMLSELKKQLGHNPILSILHAIDEFDFNKARVETQKILKFKR